MNGFNLGFQLLDILKADIKKILVKMREARKKKGLSQEYIASKLGLTREAHTRIENGVNDMTVSRLYEICEILEVNPIHIQAELHIEFSSKEKIKEIAENAINQFSKIIKDLDDDNQSEK